MRLMLSPSNPCDYDLFLKCKRLPRCRFAGEFAEFPDEYLPMLGIDQARAVRSAYVPLLGLPLFDYQRDITRLAVHRRKFAAFLEPGMGKTLIMSEWCRHVLGQIAPGRCVLIISPSMVVRQTIAEIERFYGDKLPIKRVTARELPFWLESGEESFGITNWEAMRDGLKPRRLAGLALEECFPAGTVIDILDDSGQISKKHIENCVCGDKIINAVGVDVISDVHRREVQYAIAVECGETRVITSPNHPLFTQRGWIGAQDLEPGDCVLRTAAAVRMVQNAIYAGKETAWLESVLQQILLSELADESVDIQGKSSYERNSCEDREVSREMAAVGTSEGAKGTGENHGVESNVQFGGAKKSFPPIERNTPQTFRAWGERAWFDSASEDFVDCTRTELGDGILFVAGQANSRLSIALQNRLGKYRAQSCYRSGWKLSLSQEGQGSKEGRQTYFVRVDGIEILEQGNPELEKLRDADGKLYFYDLGATRHPSYSVGGLLVHNSSMLKSMYGKWGQTAIDLGRGLEWKLCQTGTPAPNDRIEFANHAVFLDQFPTVNSFLARFFVNRGQTDNRWELKPHALEPFYRSLSHWCIFLSNPATYGWKDNVENLPPINIHQHEVPLTREQGEAAQQKTGMLFGHLPGGIVSRTSLAQIAKGHCKGKSYPTHKPDFIKALIDQWPQESTLIWCLYNEEQKRLEQILPGAASIRGSTPESKRQQIIADFQAGRIKQLISKPKMLGLGLNLQIATRQVFSGLQDSYESFFQAVKRSNRIGSTRPLNVHIPVTELEVPMVETVLKKAKRVEADTMEQERIFKSTSIDWLKGAMNNAA